MLSLIDSPRLQRIPAIIGTVLIFAAEMTSAVEPQPGRTAMSSGWRCQDDCRGNIDAIL
jgi:hypothetical protein